VHGQVPQQPLVVRDEAGQPPAVDVVVVQDEHTDAGLLERGVPLGPDLVGGERVHARREDMAQGRDPGGALDVEERLRVLGRRLPEPVRVHAPQRRPSGCSGHGCRRQAQGAAQDRAKTGPQHSREVL
jgi:hypothetical protein